MKIRICAAFLLVALIGAFAGCQITIPETVAQDILSVINSVPSVTEPFTTVFFTENSEPATEATTSEPVTEAPPETIPQTTEKVTEPQIQETSDDTEEELYKPVGPSEEPVKPSSGDESGFVPEPGKKYIAFTFDDGPHYELTYMFVDKLAEYGGKGTFFVVGNRLDSAGAAAVKYAYDKGNEIAVHGYTHTVYYDSCSDTQFKSELSKTAKAIKKATGFTPTLMRPIGGAITDKRVGTCGYDVILWNVDSNDWRFSSRGSDKNKNIKTIYNNIVNHTDENDIILMHEIYYNTYDAFSLVIDKLYNDGYRFITVSELLDRSQGSTGNLYYSAD